MKKVLQILNGIALVSVLVINYLAATGAINGKTVGEVSARYQNLFTPADYAFSIWTLIYIALFFFVIYQGLGLFSKKLENGYASKIGWWFVISCIANCAWILTWMFGYTGFSVLIMLVLLVSLIQIIFKTNMEMELLPFKKIALVWWPFCLYSGWISVALIANTAAWLTKIDWDGFGVSETIWAAIMIAVAGILNIAITWARNMREFGFVGVWALIAIVVANWEENDIVVYSAIIMSALIFISCAIHGFKNRKNTMLETHKIFSKGRNPKPGT